jgi:hypothetical protein
VVSIFSIHATFGVVDPRFTSEGAADLLDALAYEYGLPIGPGIAVVVPRADPENEEEEVLQAISPGTHEVNFIFDFDPNNEEFLNMLYEDTMWNRYNVTNQLCSTICFATFRAIDCTPTYFNMRISADYVAEDLYEKMKKQRFNH